MKTVQQRIMELKERVNIGVKFCRALLLLLCISLIANVTLAAQLHKASIELNKPEPVIIGTGTMEKVDDNVFQIIPDEELNSYQLPPIPETLK